MQTIGYTYLFMHRFVSVWFLIVTSSGNVVALDTSLQLSLSHTLKEDMTHKINFSETVLSLLQPQLQSKETDEKHSSCVLLIVAQIQLASCQGPAS
jgi:hypothetical protein